VLGRYLPKTKNWLSNIKKSYKEKKVEITRQKGKRWKKSHRPKQEQEGMPQHEHCPSIVW
jgi:hypothetical protein